MNLKTDTTKHFSYLGKDDAGRMRLFSYKDDLFTFNLSPILGYSYGKMMDCAIIIFGTVCIFTATFLMLLVLVLILGIIQKMGKELISAKVLPRLQASVQGGMELIFNTVKAKLQLQLVGVGKFCSWERFLEWGYGESGKLVLSQKPHPFHLLDWMCSL